MKKITISILGFGGRGQIYANIIKSSNNMELIAVCDINDNKLNIARRQFNIKDNYLFDNYKEMYALGKISDIIIISTPDNCHYEHTGNALDIGYDILLEKPVSTDEYECQNIQDKALKLNRKVAVCHVLRYTPFYTEIKRIIESGVIGKVITISQTENVGYWHQAHSFVRGSWNNSNTSCPMILAKCCHDVDILQWLINKDCVKVSSFGSLSFFKEENAPDGSAEYCYKCGAKECPYRAIDFYKKNKDWLDLTGRFFAEKTDENIDKFFRDENNPYARCVFRCENNVVDHQVVTMLFSGGATAQLTMTAFSKYCHRNIKVHATAGELIADMEENKITLNVFGKESKIIDVTEIADDFSYHGGGDKLLLHSFADYVSGKTSCVALTDIKQSVRSHKIAFGAEKSRVNGGNVVNIE